MLFQKSVYESVLLRLFLKLKFFNASVVRVCSLFMGGGLGGFQMGWQKIYRRVAKTKRTPSKSPIPLTWFISNERSLSLICISMYLLLRCNINKVPRICVLLCKMLKNATVTSLCHMQQYSAG